MQKFEVINGILKRYSVKAPIHRRGLEMLYDRAENRGYQPTAINIGLKTCICKNYVRNEYTPPNNDPECEIIHERIYIEDCEFRDIFNTKGGAVNG